ncbi:DNA mobilization endonuclease VirD1/MobC family subunit [Nitratireductor sp. XY-223]|uniref:DNA mobilization endonuclease VirD1/MobC family subunit n=1 Tax=Nitratireductor sp. XY-223 TaxID=2561926 RepID=UPI0010A9B254|nr:DNA mobilization endonuclease VirD1/MobC family subunit [Nitratireductor sp. XY-223]
MSKPGTKNRRRSERNTEPWKGKSPTADRRRGEWKTSTAEDDDGGVGFVHLSTKVRPEEKEAFKQACSKHGVTPNKAVRIFVRQCGGFLEISDEALQHLVTITRQISGVSTNINQIAKAGNRTLSPDFNAFMEDRKELGAQLAELEDIIREIVNVGKRRSDGLRKLEAVLAKGEGAGA